MTEAKFPELLKAIENARSHIYIEYYIYENDITRNGVAQLLIKKIKEGVELQFMYNDFGSYSIEKSFIKE